MPLYDYECPKCKFEQEAWTPMNNNAECPMCKITMKRLIGPVRYNMGASGAYGYYDDNLETYINSNRHRREVMREKGVTEQGSTPKTGVTWV